MNEYKQQSLYDVLDSSPQINYNAICWRVKKTSMMTRYV